MNVSTYGISNLVARALFAALAVSLVATPVHAAKFKCWTNKEGIRECGNVVPPEYAQQGHEVVNERGITVDRKERALTKEEIAERERIKAEKEEEEKRRKEQEAKDSVLLRTFTTVEEMELARDGRIAAVETEMRITRSNMDSSAHHLADLRKQAANIERGGKAVPEAILARVDAAQKKVDDYKRFLAKKEAEKELIRSKFTADIERYKQLRRGAGMRERVKK